ncbi:MAG: hypothetical protein VYD64_05620 [Pseudomonadota bacterium]|nr:hypothetical protein [Pseudomonadota bacterium]
MSAVDRTPDRRVTCFHGTPKKEEAGTDGSPKLRYRTLPARWLRACWLDEDEKDWMPG